MAKLVTLWLLLCASVARAQPGTVEPSPAPPAPKSPQKALGLALGVSLSSYVVVGLGAAAGAEEDDDVAVGFAVVGFGLLTVGPSAAHFYAGETARAVGGTALRAAAAGLMIYGFSNLCLAFCDDEDDGSAALAVAVGMGVFLGSAIYDVIDAPRAARRANARATAAVTPTIIRDAPGLALAGAF